MREERVMPAIATPEIIFLFEDEVRAAARLLAALRPLRANCDDEEVVGVAMAAALNACMAALAGAERDDACVMLARKPDLGLVNRPQEQR